MGVKAKLADVDGNLLHTEGLELPNEFTGDGTHLIVGTPFLAHGVFNSEVLAGAGTTVVAIPPAGGSLIITDVVISAKKVVGTSIDLRFSDGVTTEVLISPDTVNQSTNFSWVPVGRIQGWRDACVDVVTVGASFEGTVTVGYVKVRKSLDYIDWDGLR